MQGKASTDSTMNQFQFFQVRNEMITNAMATPAYTKRFRAKVKWQIVVIS